jgi:molybdenum cofactor cytidylyltransferase
VLAAIILAGGDSSRMGSPKALLRDPDGQPFVMRIATTFQIAGLSDVVVVTGRHHEEILQTVAACRPPHPRIVRNQDPSRGQLSSLLAGLDACAAGTKAVAVTLVDIPFVRADTVRAVVDAWRKTGAPIVRPAYGDRRGHPVIFDRTVFDELRATPLAAGARAVLSAHYAAIVNVPVDDPGCVVDVDTPADYDEVIRRSGPTHTKD